MGAVRLTFATPIGPGCLTTSRPPQPRPFISFLSIHLSELKHPFRTSQHRSEQCTRTPSKMARQAPLVIDDGTGYTKMGYVKVSLKGSWQRTPVGLE